MPELPEVETTCRGLLPHLKGKTINDVIVRHHGLRFAIPDDFAAQLIQQKIRDITRRGKYLLFRLEHGYVIAHLGMSGSLRIVTNNEAPRKHDHVDWIMSNNKILRYHDPRRFGCMLWTPDPQQHDLIKDLGPEPLSTAFSDDYLFERSRDKSTPVKNFIMDSHVVVGVGNIYAAESLFRAQIHPLREAGRVSRARYVALTQAIREILSYAIERGGTTLRDFVNSDGEPGYFAQELFVYGRGGERCLRCHHVLKETRLQQRSTVYCPTCQK